jgi:thiamine biosynthesis lipoprotein
MKRWALLLVLVACSRPPSGHARYEGKVMGSSLMIEVFGPDQSICDRAVADALAELRRLDDMMTDWKPVSPLMDINYAAGVKPVAVPDELFFIIKRSIQMSELTGGAFDISFAGAGKLWNWRAPDPKIPDEATVKAALANVGYKGIVLDEKAKTVFLSRPGMKIGLGGIGPGYAADLAMEKIKALGIRDACIDMSGDVLLIGKHGKEPWRVGIKHPREPSKDLAVIPAANCGVSTSGDYERFFIKDGKRYCHIIDPHTGYPADRCRSVTIVAPVLAFADGLATGVFVLGPEKGMELIEKLDGVQGIIVGADGRVWVSKGLRSSASLE